MARGTIAFAFGAARLALKGKARPSPVSAHSIQKCIPPRKRKSMERRNGARADARYSARGGVRATTQPERTIWYQTTTHAARAGSVALRLEIGSSGAVYSHHHRNFQKIGRTFALVFFSPHQRKPVRFGRAAAPRPPR